MTEVVKDLVARLPTLTEQQKIDAVKALSDDDRRDVISEISGSNDFVSDDGVVNPDMKNFIKEFDTDFKNLFEELRPEFEADDDEDCDILEGDIDDEESDEDEVQ